MKIKRETRKEEILRVAAKCFKEKGYSAVTMRYIASVMGIKASSLYNHINSKQDILDAIIITLAKEFSNGMQLIKSCNASCIHKLNRIIELHVRISSQNIYGMASLNNDWMHLEAKLEQYQKLRVDYENDFRAILISGIASGEIINVRPDFMLFSILTTLRSLYVWIPKKEDITPKELSKSLSQILISGITN